MTDDEIAAALLTLRFPAHHREEAAIRLLGKHWQPMTELPEGDQQ